MDGSVVDAHQAADCLGGSRRADVGHAVTFQDGAVVDARQTADGARCAKGLNRATTDAKVGHVASRTDGVEQARVLGGRGGGWRTDVQAADVVAQAIEGSGELRAISDRR